MTDPAPHSLLTGSTPLISAYKAQLGYDAKRASKRMSVHEAVARFVHYLEIPAMMAGDTVGRRTYEADHRLVLGYNLFSRTIKIDQRNQDEPVVVGFVADGSVTNITNSVPAQESEAVVRCSVHGVTEAAAVDCAWRLWDLFKRRPGFENRLAFDCGSDDEIQAGVDLTVQSLHPLDEPAIAERLANRVHVSFRLFSRHHRSDQWSA